MADGWAAYTSLHLKNSLPSRHRATKTMHFIELKQPECDEINAAGRMEYY
jgi:hypothetical protein